MLKSELEKILGYEVEATENSDFGDYSSNVALSHKPPREFAEMELVKLKANKKLNEFVDKIEIAGPGFINFWLKRDVLVGNLTQIVEEKEKYGTNDTGKGKLAIVEYSSPNIAKPFTVGHLRSTIIGDAVANLLTASGWKVMRDNHLGDWGTQFGKQIYAIKAWGNEEEIAKSENPVKELVALYVKFHEEAEKDPSIEDGARAWFKKLEDGDQEAKRLWQKCIDWSFVEFDKIYSTLNVSFSDEFEGGRGLGESFFESRMGIVIDELTKKRLLKVGKEGAKLVFFPKDKYPALMIVKKDGATLYATRDLATDKYRKEKYDPDLIINEVGSEQALYFRQIYETEKLLGWFKDEQRVHIGHGLIRFKEGKMSTRKGNVIWMEEVLNEALSRAKKLGSDSEKLIKEVAIGALKYNDLKRDSKTDIVFDWDEILNMEGNSGPYLQYTVARTNSVLSKARSTMHDARDVSDFDIRTSNLNDEELGVLRTLVRFPEVIATASKNYSPNLLCNYLYDLAQKYNGFYNAHKIIGGENEEFKLELTKGVGQVLKNGLKLLGIQTPEKM
ncbi:MAG TPA: arginine--tRNA ligase [Patescibacteria group bacterium]|nr:arginine--tRNA ligase [Patescibacteria group bacterium]